MNDLSSTTVLVADTDESTRSFLGSQLTADGYEVLLAACPAEVHARASRGPVAIVVLGDFERLAESIALCARSAPAMAATASSIPDCRSWC